jgi:hypothetical protein
MGGTAKNKYSALPGSGLTGGAYEGDHWLVGCAGLPVSVKRQTCDAGREKNLE